MERLCLLLIENDLDAQFSITFSLIGDGRFDVTPIDSPDGALDLLAYGGQRFNLILVDSSIPKIKGVDLSSLVQALPSCEALHSIVVLTENPQSYSQHPVPANIIGFISKPFDVVALPQQIIDLYERGAIGVSRF